ncbi:DUF6488 family protein [Nitrosospira sp. NpAV]|uniref:DUF6488 family protein n=1 Tax=Nitrosospira sp. NpAV TaxID=58133 RepID=UPI00059EF5E7|nr:DUF6488 family protein [Nitrosospira sp. NpAV]KIO48683.1 hypothetical protein SQ11_10430 [Nitrosospira sp. NpAV]
MKKILMVTIITAASLSATMVLADERSGCHFHGNTAATSETVASCAHQRKGILIKNGKIAKSWLSVPQDNIEQVDGKKGKEWVVTFKDPNAKDKTKETLHVYFTATGNFIAANFTGK